MCQSIPVFLFLALLMGQIAIGQNIVIVAKDGSGSFTSIQKAIDSLADDDAPKIVQIRPGVY